MRSGTPRRLLPLLGLLALAPAGALALAQPRVEAAPVVPAGKAGNAGNRGLVGKAAPAFTLRRLDGKPLALKELRGTVALLNFWDFGCPSCNLEVRHLEKLHRKYAAKGLRVVGIAELEPDARKVKRFLQQYDATYPVVLDPEQRVARRFEVMAHPATIILDRNGIVRFVHTGFLKGDEVTLENAVKAVLEGDKLARL